MTRLLSPRMFLLLSVLSAQSAARAGVEDGCLDIYWVDVEGGAATLMVTPAGESLLVDSGNPGRRDAGRIFDVAAKVAKLRRIDNLVTTHYHRDHFGGAATLHGVLPIARVFDNGEFPGGRERPDKEYLQFDVETREVVKPGDEIPLKQVAGSSKLEVTCLACRQEMIDPPRGAKRNTEPDSKYKPKDRDDTDNANSIVLLASFGDFRFFDAGDLTWNIEYRLIHPFDLIGRVDVYQTTHHGLDQSNNNLLVRSLSPTVAVMNNGTTKGCEPETFATLASTPSIDAIYQVHKNLRVDGERNNAPDEYIANLEENCQANYIKLSVAPDGRSYRVAIPANGHERTYATRK